jgi:adenylosuccinate synthase
VGDLPERARRYLARIEELVGCPIRRVSVGTKRDQILSLADPLVA